MLIFLHGPDDWRREQRKKFYVKEFEKKYSGLNVRYFDFTEEGAPEDLREFLRSSPLFEEKKLAVLENLREADGKKLAEALKPVRAEKDAVVLCSEDKKPAGSLSFLAAPQKPSLAEEFGHFVGAELAAFVEKEAKNRGVALSADALKFLSEAYARNSWGLVTELEKLAGFNRREIGRGDLEALGLETVPDYWVTVQSLKSQKLGTRLWALEKLFARKEPPAKVFNVLTSVWREKTPLAAERDFTVKSGKLEYEEALLELALSG